MLNLIKLELKKNKLGWFVNGIILANVIILGLLCMLPIVERLEGEQTFTSLTDYFMVSGELVRGTMIVFAAVLISKIIIDEFKNRTHLVMFSYPINRKKILSAKLILIFCITLFSMMITNLFVIHGFIGLNNLFHFTTTAMTFTSAEYTAGIGSLFMFNLATAGAALVPLYFGMRKFSTPATIVSSLFIVMVTCSSGEGFSLASIIYIPLALALVALGIVVLAVRKIEHIDLN